MSGYAPLFAFIFMTLKLPSIFIKIMHNFMKLILLIVFLMLPVSIQAQTINRVVAVVNDEVITHQDITQLLAVLYAQYVHDYRGDELLKKMESVKKDILKQVVEDKLVLSRAKELNIEITDEEIKERLDYIQTGFESEADFLKTLQDQGITVSDLKDRYRDQIMMKKIVDYEIRSKVTVQPSEITAYYEGHRYEFERGEKCKVRHILVKADNVVNFELAKVEMYSVFDKLRKGEDFGKLAKEHSQGPNKDEGGDMGYISRGEMIRELEEVFIKLKPGQFSGPIKSNIGYHILMVEDVKDFGSMSLEDAQKDIKKMLFQQKFQKKLDEWLAGLRNSAYISIK